MLEFSYGCYGNGVTSIGDSPGDEVIVPAYTYTASASVVAHVGATIVMVDAQSECVEMDYNKLADAITEKTKVIVPVDLAGICVNLDKIYEVINSPEIKAKFTPSNDIQRKIGRIIVSNDCAHSFGANRHGKMAGEIADFSSFSFHAVKNFTTAEGGALTWNLPFGQEKWNANRYIVVRLCHLLKVRHGMSFCIDYLSCSRFMVKIKMLLQRQNLVLGNMTSSVLGINVT